MALIKKQEYKKPKLKKGDIVLRVNMPDGPITFTGQVSEVTEVKNGKVKVKGDDTEFSDEGIADHERAVLLPRRIRDSWQRSPFLKNALKLGAVTLNLEMLLLLDEENESVL